MKKGVLIAAVIMTFLVTLPFISAACNLDVQMLNQDPYPAIPGEYVEVVFQMTGVEDPSCGRTFIDAVSAFPFFIEPDSTKMTIPSGTYLTGYESFVLKGYKLLVDENAIDGANKLELNYGGSLASTLTEDFFIEVENPLVDFDISIQEYDIAKNTITFGVINIGEKDIEALTLEVPSQDNVYVKGTNKIIIGSLNSNDDTTVNLEVVPKEGDLTVKLEYNDQTNTRRTVEKKVYFSKGYLESDVQESKGYYYYLFWGLLLILFVYFVYGYYNKRKRRMNNKKFLLLRNR